MLQNLAGIFEGESKLVILKGSPIQKRSHSKGFYNEPGKQFAEQLLWTPRDFIFNEFHRFIIIQCLFTMKT